MDGDMDRVIPGSRRPDGTYRKDVRVKAGYVPQDEQPVYQSRGALAKQGVPRVPGMDESEIDTAKAAAKTKAAKRNEKRKQKKAVAGSDLTTSSRKQEGNLADALENMVLDASNDNGSHPEESTFSALDKKIRAVKKKLKQADVLRDRQKAGDTLTGPELEKLKNAETWRDELLELESSDGPEIEK